MTYKQRICFFVFADSFLILSAAGIGSMLTYGNLSLKFEHIGTFWPLLAGHHILWFSFHIYKKSWEYASIEELKVLIRTVAGSSLAAAGFEAAIYGMGTVRLMAVTCMLYAIFIAGSRLCIRLTSSGVQAGKEMKRTMIIGAGSAGIIAARLLLKSRETDLLPVIFVDDDKKKRDMEIMGIPVAGDTRSIQSLAVSRQIERIIIAIPSLGAGRLKEIYEECMKTDAKTQTIPLLEDLLAGRLTVNKLRDVQVEDLLGRELVELDIEAISDSLMDKTVLVSGAGGSIGSEICRQIASFRPRKIVLLGHGENSIYSIEMELKELYPNGDIHIEPEIADLQDARRMVEVMNIHQPDVVYHAAAHKHVPLMERNPEEAVKNNIIGTKNIAQAASWNSVGTFVMISSDKAVNPTSVMGATKRLAEMVIQQMDKESETKFVAVRFGNVLGSRGSVIPRFRKQIERGGPVTVTHPDMVRYFMTIPEASRLVIQAGALAKGGEIFVLDMGQPIRILDLAKNLIRLSGNREEDIPIVFTGMRPGEKLFEELLKSDEIHEEQIHPNIYIGKSGRIITPEIEEIILHYAELDKESLRIRLLDLANERTEKPYLSFSG